MVETLQALSIWAMSTPGRLDPRLKQRVMDQLGRSPATSARESRPGTFDAPVIPLKRRERSTHAARWLGAALAASVILLIGTVAQLFRAHAQTRQAAGLLVQRDQLLAARDALIDQLVDPGVDMITLISSGQARPAVKAFFNRGQRHLTIATTSLETPPAGRAYQLWFIVNGKPVPSVTFVTDRAGRAIVNVTSIPSGAAAAAITTEPQSGSAAPTSAVLFAAKFSSE
jgi:hypothetical protein